MKKILMLGGSRYIIPVIEAAHQLGLYVITCDYLPCNIGHKYSDAYYNVSIIEKEKVLELARNLNISGIMSFACDPGVATAAYIAEQLGLPGSPYQSVKILQNKDLFRKFLCNHSFNVPMARSYSDPAEVNPELEQFKWPVIVKPVDSAGSKGVTKVEAPEDLPFAIKDAISHSIRKEFIIEEFIEKAAPSSDTDCFSINGNLVFSSFSNQLFDDDASNPYTPAAYSWPSTMPNSVQSELTNEIQRLLTLLKMQTSIYNVETRLGIDGKPYIMEISPRGGGNRLAEVLRYATGTDLIMNAVKAAVGLEIDDIKPPKYNGYWAEVILHSSESGEFVALEISDNLRSYVVEEDLWVTSGDTVNSFTGANEAIGTLILNFDTQERLSFYMSHIKSNVRVVTR